MKFFDESNKCCANCQYSIEADEKFTVFCCFRGNTGINDSCKKFKYDVLKRKPQRIKPSGNYSPEDFSL